MGFDRGNFNRGGRGSFNRGGSRGGGNRNFDNGPPERVIEVGHFLHACENDLVCSTTCGKIPFFNAPIYFENKEMIGKIDEIFGSPQENGFSVKLSEGIKSSSFKDEQKLFIDPAKLLPVERFLPGAQSSGPRGRGGPRGASRGRGGPSRGGFSRGSRGGFSSGGNDRKSFGNDNGSRGGGFRGNTRGRGDFRGNSSRGGNFGGRADRGGGFKRPSDNSFGGGQNKKIKFDS